MMISIDTYMQRGKHILRRWTLDPRAHGLLRAAAHFFAGFVLSAASLGANAQPFAMGLVCACTGGSAVLAALGSVAGYLLFWGSAGYQGVLWVAAGLAVALFLGDRSIRGDSMLLFPALAGLIVSAGGVAFQIFLEDTTSIAAYLIRVAVGASSATLFYRVLRGRNPVLDWITCGIAVLSLAQIVPVTYLGLGFVAAGALPVAGAFPAAALAGVALDLAQVTPVSMTAVLCGSYLVRFLPRYPKALGALAPGLTYLLVMGLCHVWDAAPLPGLILGGCIGNFLPGPVKTAHRRGETGIAQVRLEMAAGVLIQSQQLLLEAPDVPVDEAALVNRAAERACSSCPCRKSCKDTSRLGQLPSVVLHKQLLTPEELPIVCRKPGRVLAELHRSQEQLRSIRADRERQREYRAAVVQQFRFLSEYLQELSDQLARRIENNVVFYSPWIHIYGNRPDGENGDKCWMFPGVGSRYYVLLCDGMGTGLGAVHEARQAGNMLQQLLSAGYPAEHALRSLNSICALRERAGAVTVDLLELSLDTGKAVIYKWGAAPSYLVNSLGAEKIGTAGPPPGLSVTQYRETAERLSLRRGETLVLVSDGVGEEEALHCCLKMTGQSPGELAAALLACGQLGGEDDATVVLVRLNPGAPAA